MCLPVFRVPGHSHQEAYERLHGLVPGAEEEDGPAQPQDAQLRDLEAARSVSTFLINIPYFLIVSCQFIVVFTFSTVDISVEF